MSGGGGPTLTWSVTHGRRPHRFSRTARYTISQLAILAVVMVALVITLVDDAAINSAWLPLSLCGVIMGITVAGSAWALHGEKE